MTRSERERLEALEQLFRELIPRLREIDLAVARLQERFRIATSR